MTAAPDMAPAPELVPWIVVHPPMADGAAWIVERPEAAPLRVSADVGNLLSAIDGERDAAALAVVLGPRWTPEAVGGAVESLERLGLLRGPGSAPPKPPRRVVVVSPTTVQFRVVRTARVLDPFRGLITRLPGGAVVTAAVVLSLAGLPALLFQPSTALGTPLPVSAMALIWVGVSLTTIGHELAHGAVLTRFRGRPGWLGVMLFYLTPACFCEVTDGWRLARRGQRVAVALAGVATQTSIAGAAALGALVLPDGDARVTLVGFAVVCYLSGVVNLLPLVKLDGYLALMSHLDVPRLREKAMADARAWLAHRLFGVPMTRQLPGRAWVVPFGVACAVFPVVVVLLAASRWGHLLLGAGVPGAVLLLLLAGYLLYLAVRGAVRLLRTPGVGPVRRIATGLVGCLLIAAPLTLLHLPERVAGGYVRDGSEVHLVVPPGTDPSALRPGRSAVLRRSGLLTHTDLGRAEVAGPARSATAPLGALAPLRSDVPVDAVLVPVRGAPEGLDAAGSAYLPGEPVPAGLWLARTYVLPAWRQVFGQENQ